jgi:outer membrane protein assembly factor BamB
MRGTAYRSRDLGRSWQKLETGLMANITAAVALEDGRTLFASQDGRVIVLDAAGERSTPVPVARPTLLTGVVQVDGATLVLTGLNGVQRARIH